MYEKRETVTTHGTEVFRHIIELRSSDREMFNELLNEAFPQWRVDRKIEPAVTMIRKRLLIWL